METQKVIKMADESLTGLIGRLSDFDEQQINMVPFEDSWTAGQLAQHMIMANSGFVDVINGPAKDTIRNPDKFASQIKADFLNFDIKMKSPDFVKPEIKDYDRNELLSALKNIRTNMLDAVGSLDLTQTCTSFELPVYGYLTRLESVCFITYHTQRHLRQLKNIHSVLIK